MAGKNINSVRKILRGSTTGMSIPDLAKLVGTTKGEMSTILRKRMTDTYIHHWESNGYGWKAIWCVVVPPTDAVRPSKAKPVQAESHQRLGL